jgi:hypothetical protein
MFSGGSLLLLCFIIPFKLPYAPCQSCKIQFHHNDADEIGCVMDKLRTLETIGSLKASARRNLHKTPQITPQNLTKVDNSCNLQKKYFNQIIISPTRNSLLFILHDESTNSPSRMQRAKAAV